MNTMSGNTQDKGELRRRQLLEAAADCFRRKGFHGTSIACISRSAKMSPGHIYHYFANKEAIVAAIVEREHNYLSEMIQELERERDCDDFVDALVRQVEATMERNLDPAHVGLMLEITAEAARNDKIAAMLRRSDQAVMERFAELMQKLSGKHLPCATSAPEIRARLETISTLMSGLALRSICNPALDRTRLTQLVEGSIRHLLEQTS
jgi:AcrR family transcriptional regulator